MALAWEQEHTAVDALAPKLAGDKRHLDDPSYLDSPLDYQVVDPLRRTRSVGHHHRQPPCPGGCCLEHLVPDARTP